MPVIYALVLAAPSVTLPGDARGLRRIQSPPIASDVRLGQTFRMAGNGLYGIEVSATPVIPNVVGMVRLDLYDVTTDREPLPPVRSVAVNATELVRAPSYRFEFPPIPDSEDRVYRADFISSDTTPNTGVALWATQGTRYDGGAFLINGTARWADLTFRALAPAPSIRRLLMTMRTTSPARTYVVLAAFPLMWLLFGVFLRALAGDYGARQ
jgi:hypothetical protein